MCSSGPSFRRTQAIIKVDKTHKRLGTWEFYKGALAIALPIMLQQLIQNLVSLIDNFMVSGLGDICMSGVNIANQVILVFIIFWNTICMSGGIYLTQYFGAKNSVGMQQAFKFKLVAGLLSLIPFFIVCICIPRQVLSLMVVGNTDAAAILDQGVAYMRIIFFMGPPMVFSLCIATSLRDTAKVKAPLYISVFATLVNTFFNWMLIYGHLGAPRLEVRGAAIATVIARSVELIIYLVFLAYEKPNFAFKPSKILEVDWPLFGEIFKKSSMVLISEMVWILSETITTALYNGRGGADVVSGMAAGFAIANLFFVAFGGATTATSVIIGKSLGAGMLDEARQQKEWLLTGSIILGFITMLVAFASTGLIPIVFGRLSPEARQITFRLVILIGSFMIPWVYLVCQLAVSRAGGDTAMGAFVDATVTLFVTLPIIFALAKFTNIGPLGLYLAVRIIDAVKIAAFNWWLNKERWVRNLAEDTVTVGGKAK